jgi:hypothetical protein
MQQINDIQCEVRLGRKNNDPGLIDSWICLANGLLLDTFAANRASALLFN